MKLPRPHPPFVMPGLHSLLIYFCLFSGGKLSVFSIPEGCQWLFSFSIQRFFPCASSSITGSELIL